MTQCCVSALSPGHGAAPETERIGTAVADRTTAAGHGGVAYDPTTAQTDSALLSQIA